MNEYKSRKGVRSKIVSMRAMIGKSSEIERGSAIVGNCDSPYLQSTSSAAREMSATVPEVDADRVVLEFSVYSIIARIKS